LIGRSAVLFVLAHHAGTPAESFTWFAFIFRWMAGVFFAWVFVIRGFGIAVGTHTGYDILVGCFGWRFWVLSFQCSVFRDNRLRLY
jgi:hypothetical protein